MLCYVELLWVKLIIVNSYQMTAFSLVHVFFALRNDNTLVDKHHLIYGSIDSLLLWQHYASAYIDQKLTECLRKGSCQIQ